MFPNSTLKWMATFIQVYEFGVEQKGGRIIEVHTFR